ncbi:nucleotidyltransferase domain-containing protein [Ectothiorhodospira magna]|uniref:nucleotidyltransferase domain-containing protein n=1 Tax=Ectothiorhodospira magna TaxID=867345 RepID=UPI000B7DD14C
MITLTSRVPRILQIWLIGSHANGQFREDSDWDFIVFSDSASIVWDKTMPRSVFSAGYGEY